jgi:hypothetical protein
MSAPMHIRGLEQILANRGVGNEGLMILSGNALVQKVVAWSVYYANLLLLNMSLTWQQV